MNYSSENLRPFTTNPALAETVNRLLLVATMTPTTARAYFSSIYLSKGMLLTGVHAYAWLSAASAGTYQWLLWDGAGTLLANTAVVAANTSQARRTNAFTSTYTVPTAGYYYVGCRYIGVGVAWSSLATYLSSTGFYPINDMNTSTTTTTISQVSSGSVALASATNISGLTYTREIQNFYYGLY